jgi:hypothetical protein
VEAWVIATSLIFLYLLGTVVLGVVANRRMQVDLEDFLLYGRKAGFVVLYLTVVASFHSARGPPQSDLLTGLPDQTPTFDPTRARPRPGTNAAGRCPSSTSPCPTTSTPELSAGRRMATPSPTAPIQASRRRIPGFRTPVSRPRPSQPRPALARRPLALPVASDTRCTCPPHLDYPSREPPFECPPYWPVC